MNTNAFTRAYKGVALVLLNTVVLWLLLNGTVLFFEAIQGPLVQPSHQPESEALMVYGLGTLAYGMDPLRSAYPGQDDQDTIRLLLESWNIPLQCDDMVPYREAPFQGQHVRVDEAGFRAYGAQAWPPESDSFTVFVFGGSTTFGYGERDEHTIPAYLQEHLALLRPDLAASVYNFGHAYFFSELERRELARLVQSGVVPDVAVFIDGINDFYHADGQPTMRPCLGRGWMSRARRTLLCQPGEFCWPLQRLASALGSRDQAAGAKVAGASDDHPQPGDPSAVVSRWFETKERIETMAKEQGIQTLFVVQPSPAYAYDLQNHPFAHSVEDLGKHARSREGYGLWEEELAPGAGNVLNLAHLGEGREDVLYVDRVHYSATFMEAIAREIASEISISGRMAGEAKTDAGRGGAALVAGGG